MIILVILSLFVSLVIQTVMSNLIGYTYESLSIFTTIYLLLNLLIVKPYYENKHKYFILILIVGLITDITFSNTFILNTCLFIVISLVSSYFHSLFPYNIITINISNLIGIFTYHLLSFVVLNLLSYGTFSFNMLLSILLHSIIMTIVYTSLLYIILEKIKIRYDLKEIK